MAGGELGVSTAMALHLLCGLGLMAAYWVAVGIYRWTLITDPTPTLRLLLLTHGPIVIGAFSAVRSDADQCPYWKAAARGILGLPVGALLNAFGAIVLGAPVGIKYFQKTLSWSLLMSLFTFVPASCAFGSSVTDWQNILAHSKPIDAVNSLISLPAHGAVIGAWLGAWPMPLDWERPWQEWPICVTYGAVIGYLVGLLASLLFVLVLKGRAHVKED